MKAFSLTARLMPLEYPPYTRPHPLHPVTLMLALPPIYPILDPSGLVVDPPLLAVRGRRNHISLLVSLLGLLNNLDIAGLSVADGPHEDALLGVTAAPAPLDAALVFLALIATRFKVFDVCLLRGVPAVPVAVVPMVYGLGVTRTVELDEVRVEQRVL